MDGKVVCSRDYPGKAGEGAALGCAFLSLGGCRKGVGRSGWIITPFFGYRSNETLTISWVVG